MCGIQFLSADGPPRAANHLCRARLDSGDLRKRGDRFRTPKQVGGPRAILRNWAKRSSGHLGGGSYMTDAAGLVAVRLSVDADRDGDIEPDNPRKHSWVWGPDGVGAVVAVDRDLDGFSEEDGCHVILTVAGLPPKRRVHLSLDASSEFNVTVTHANGDGEQMPILGAGVPVKERRGVSRGFNDGVYDLYMFAHFFADGSFDGLTQLYAEILDLRGNKERADPADAVLLRVTPWIMPNHLDPPAQLYVCTYPRDSRDPGFDNVELVEMLRTISKEQALEPLVEFRSPDPWIQDEIEFGYSVLPDDSVRHICVDGPRDRELDTEIERVVGSNAVGVYSLEVQREYRNSLDSFGNLEVSPPVPGYPLGRIVLGTKLPLERGGRRSQFDVRRFLHSQLVQEPLEIYSDWLYVGHVDEFLCFEPDPDATHGFRIQTVSPRALRQMLTRLAGDGHGAEVLWKGRQRVRWTDAGKQYLATADETIDELLAKDLLWAYNDELDEILDGIRKDLAVELQVPDTDFHEVPCMFKAVGDENGDGVVDDTKADPLDRAVAYFPDMVNHLVVGPTSIVPRPYGPRIDGIDALEKAFIAAAGPTRDVRFVDDWLMYHEMLGEVHCGTNTRRSPAQVPEWWVLKPRRALDMSFRQRS